jgi:anti-anti-sigma factor
VHNVEQRDRQGRAAFRAATGGTDSAVVVMRGEFDAQARRDFDREVSRLLAASPRRIVVDMGAVDFVDSTWIRLLEQLRARACHEGQASVRISAVSPAARRALELGGVVDLFEMPPENSDLPPTRAGQLDPAD